MLVVRQLDRTDVSAADFAVRPAFGVHRAPNGMANGVGCPAVFISWPIVPRRNMCSNTQPPFLTLMVQRRSRIQQNARMSMIGVDKDNLQFVRPDQFFKESSIVRNM